MSARKLGRFAGLVFALALAVGGAGAAWAGQDEGNPKVPGVVVVEEPASSPPATQDEPKYGLFDWHWT